MSFRRPLTNRSATLLGSLLLTTAFVVPALAQIETVTVTAEKRAEDIQSVPIAVTAYTGQDLATHQITQFKDFQFSTPSISYTKTNFTSSNFQIRGIGTQVISGDAESGVAFDIDDVYYANAPVDSGQFYDIERVEILRGPQSTLYGRGATGGTVSVFTNKPKLDAMSADLYASYGNYNAAEVKGAVNLPIITDQLGVRLAGDWVRHDGYATNIYPGTDDRHPDGRDQWSLRGSVRWQPTEDTTIDVSVSHATEDDSRMRGQKQLCDFDPSGVLGCLPDAVTGGSGAVNLNATFFNIPVSYQSVTGTFGPTGPGGLTLQALLAPYGPTAFGLFNLAAPYTAPAGAVPSDARTINADVSPVLRSKSNSVTINAHQKVTSWLDATLVAGYADGNVFSRESYVNAPGAPFDQTALATSKAAFQNALNNYVTAGLVPASYANPTTGPYAFILNPSHAGTLPTSNFTNLGIIGGDIYGYSANEFAYDQSNGTSSQKSVEFRLQSNFQGPLNFLLAGYYLNVKSSGDYFVGSNTLDYGQVLLGALLGPLLNAQAQAHVPPLTNYVACRDMGCIFGTPYYDNRTNRTTVDSKAIFGEVYYDAIPDTLKFTVGLRGTEDIKDNEGRITILSGPIPIGETDSDAALAECVALRGCDFDAGVTGPQVWQETERKFDKLTGRAVINYTPKLDFTDQTMFYVSYARGYKAGGSNPGVQVGNLSGIPATYEPETIDAYELGTKNTLLDGHLQANFDIWYYNYGDYQISSIIANTSVNTNINTFLHGFEGEFLWAATDQLQFNLNFNVTNSNIGKTAQIDTRNPGGGLSYGLVIKDGTLTATNAQNCVLYHNGTGATAANFDADFATLSSLTGGLFFAPPGSGTAAQNVHQLAGSGVPNAAFGTCNGPILAQVAGALTAAHFTTSDAATGGSLTGVPVNIHGNELANTPPAQLSFGAQYTQPVGGDYSLVGRFDIYWQAAMWGRIFNGPADKIDAYTVANAQISLLAPDDKWEVQAYIKNIGNGVHTTGEYLTSSSSGLYTGAFYGDPRTYGIAFLAHL